MFGYFNVDRFIEAFYIIIPILRFLITGSMIKIDENSDWIDKSTRLRARLG